MSDLKNLLFVFLLFFYPAISRCFQKRETRKQYAMYVWTTGFDRGVAGCGQVEFKAWNQNSPCFTHVWNTATKREWLWATCNLPGREVSAIFISDVHQNLKAAYDSGNCNSPAIQTVKQMLQEGHAKVLDLKIYGLYAVSDIDVSEKDLVKYIVYYNDHCAANQLERFDGVATNNEAYTPIKCGDLATRLTYLDNLHKIVTQARKQVHGALLTHYSVGYIIHPAVADRMRTAGYDYALSQNKQVFATVYTNPVRRPLWAKG